MKTKLIIAAIAAFFIAGCEITEAAKAETRRQIGKESARHIGEASITLSDGRKITCLTYGDGYTAGLSCDWHNTQQPK